MTIALCILSIITSILIIIIDFGNAENISFLGLILVAISIIKFEIVKIKQEHEYAIDPMALSNFEISKRYKNFSFPQFDSKGNSRLRIIECELENTEDTLFGINDMDIFKSLEIGDRIILAVNTKYSDKKRNVYAMTPSQIFIGWIPENISAVLYDRLRNQQTVFARIKYVDTFDRHCIIEIARYSQRSFTNIV